MVYLTGAAVILGLIFWSEISGSSAHATRSERPSAANLISRSALVLRVRATNVDPRAFDRATDESLTHVELTILERLAGAWPSKSISFSLRGGLLPDGKLRWFDLPMMTEGESYLIFVRPGEYATSPFTNEGFGVMREAQVGGTLILVDQDGRAVLGLGENGFEIGDKVTDSEFVTYTRKLGWSFTDAVGPIQTSQSTGRAAPSAVAPTQPPQKMAPADAVFRILRSMVAKRSGTSGSIANRPTVIPD
jgi:hypothetical protein